MLISFIGEEDGTTMVEMTIVATLLLVLALGFVDFGYAFYQWNAGNKAVQVGARLAAVSDPIATELESAVDTVPSGASPGDRVPAGTYDFVCIADATGTATCNDCSSGTCTPSGTDQAAFDLIFDGDSRRPGMHRFLPALKKSEIQIEYVATGLDYWTRPGGPVPTIKVSIRNHKFHFFFLGGLLGFTDITMPSMLSTVTGEDLSTSYSP